MKRNQSFIIILIAFIFLASVTLHAKKDIIVSFNPTDSLSGTISFNTVEVIDARKDKSNIGHASFGRQEIKTKDSLSIELKHLAETMMMPGIQKGDQDLLIVLHGLSLQDVVMEQRLISTIYIDIDCYLGKNDSYIPVAHLDSVYEIPKKPVEILLLLTDYIFTQTIQDIAVKDMPVDIARVSITEILSREAKVKRELPIYNQAYKTGVYYTFEQFSNNTPGNTSIYHDHFFTGDTHVDRFYLSSPKKKKEKDLSDTTCFAIYNGKKWFKPYTANTFKEMKMIDGDFYYFGITEGLKLEDYSAVAGVGIPYGALAAVITTSIAHGLNEKEKSKPLEYDDALFRMRLDPLTGKGKKLERIR
jgi:hypothetical protein